MGKVLYLNWLTLLFALPLIIRNDMNACTVFMVRSGEDEESKPHNQVGIIMQRREKKGFCLFLKYQLINNP